MPESTSRYERRRAKQLIKETRRLDKRYGKRLRPEQREELALCLEELERAQEAGTPLVEPMRDLEHVASHSFAPFRKSVFREYIESILVAVCIALVLRTFLIEPFKIPSGSMIPTLAIGDHIFVNKLSYGLWLPFAKQKWRWGQGPQRGDVIVFVYPKDPEKDFIKRVVGLPGDEIEVKNNRLYINNQLVSQKKSKKHQYHEKDDGDGRWYKRHGRIFVERFGSMPHKILHDEGHAPPAPHWSSRIDGPQSSRKWGPKVAPGYVFVMGDNRDHSSDSREWGLVPIKNIKGRAILIWLSYNESEGFQWDRLFRQIQ